MHINGTAERRQNYSPVCHAKKSSQNNNPDKMIIPADIQKDVRHLSVCNKGLGSATLIARVHTFSQTKCNLSTDVIPGPHKLHTTII